MKKPRKHIYSDTEYCYVCEEFSPCSHNALYDAMSTWLEGEVPTVGELMEVLNDRTTWHPKSGIVFRDDVSLTSMAEAIHELFQRKLTGKV